MKLVENVYEIAERFMRNSIFVELDYEGIVRTANKMIECGRPASFHRAHEILNEQGACLAEIIGGAINYCYWYGKSNFRPLDCRSSKMYDVVLKGMDLFPYMTKFDEVIDEIISLLALNRFPLLEERKVHLKELVEKNAVDFAVAITNGDHKDCEIYLNNLVCNYTGYASDMFLKRASLLFLQLYRKFGWFEESMNILHIPADYQVPKVLEHYGCIKYSEGLKKTIDNDMLIPKHSVCECEIRSATVLACKELARITKWNMSDIDGWLWLGRKSVDGPFHLTITTDY